MKATFASRRKIRAVGQDDDDTGSRDGGSETDSQGNSMYCQSLDHLNISDMAQLQMANWFNSARFGGQTPFHKT